MSTHDERDHERDDFDAMIERVMGMDDEALDAMVGELSASYNAPPRPPAAAMWTRIAAAQRPVRRVSGHPAWQRWQLLAASVAFLAFGVTIGREWAVRTHERDRSIGSVRTTPAVAPVAASPDTTMPLPAASVAAAAAPRADGRTTEARTAVAAEVPHTRTSNDANGVASSSVRSGVRNATSDGSDAAYRLATLRHFTAAEALLASYDASGKDAKADAQLASWASDLLAQTRLLLDSPAARDPVRRKLLQDLELVLVQMAQLSPASPGVEHDLIDGSVRHNDILTRLHTAVPAGATTEL